MSASNVDRAVQIENMINEDSPTGVYLRNMLAESKAHHEHQESISFAYRHFGLLFGLGLLMALSPMFAMVILGGTMDFTTTERPLFNVLISVALAGVVLIYFSFIRHCSNSTRGAVLKTFLTLAALMAILVPVMGLWDKMLHGLMH